MPSELKLTKKQKKGIAFRERRGKGHSKTAEEDLVDIPELEIQDSQEKVSDEQSLEQYENVGRSLGDKRKRAPEEDGQAAEVNESPEKPNGVSPKRKSKKRKADKSSDDSSRKDISGEDAKSKRFILFVGNLPYSISKEQILEHFSECKPEPSIRLLSPKSRSGKPQTAVQAAKSKGCAFLEFSSHSAMQVAIRKHHSELAGRRINVELTAGGGGNSDQRKEKLRTRNHTLNEQRKKGAERRTSKNNGSDDAGQPLSRLPIRHSTTSGEVEAASRPKTWSIPTAEDEEPRARKTRGKSKGANAVQNRNAWAPSGANAIKVG
ncbi:Nucleolar protein 6 OS=Saccharomyces cerevisiae (strain ATCC 204508 / S288c) GN=NOP6 PE=1 SV=1 [Rhizoctonia solani AG-1 IB]|uniref:Nucleolar protein 6 n=1 Tax=Thanatephorus cucumeris (strain AG1-IB / isolate 7/3/14) TaxID=1108050 RepID=A0A0B7FAK4_THACB|nr:Nucleolar protein 6 OS=Saccharomyces cerevisiae (strain ATCC 204508 / S288c) GN=NOP6 PE=1 SV=1 [Rhizoctonia solani AG-1 IB]